jgi:hypothetical protein
LNTKKEFLDRGKIFQVELENFVFCPKICFGKKSSKFWQVIVNYGRFVGFKEQLEFFEFCYELALANHAKKNYKTSLRPFFTKMCVFWTKH